MHDLFFAPAGQVGVTLCFLILGLLVGSFLNVVIYRLPIMMQREWDNAIAEERNEPLPHQDRFNLVVPRSACPHCKHQIGVLENIPILSYLFQGGKCKHCKAPIRLRYPLVEALTGVLCAAVIWHFGSGYAGLAGCVATCLLVTMSFIDADTQLLPDDLNYLLLWGGLAVNLYSVFVPLDQAVMGAIVGYCALWIISQVYALLRNMPGMGMGDFKMVAALGACLGWQVLPGLVLIASAVGTLIGGLSLLLARRGFETRIPFGPYLAISGWICMLYGKEITQWLFPTLY